MKRALQHALPRAALLAALAAAAAGCRQPAPDPPDEPVEPQAAHTELRDAIQAPIGKAKAADTAVQQAAEAQRAAIEAAEGG